MQLWNHHVKCMTEALKGHDWAVCFRFRVARFRASRAGAKQTVVIVNCVHVAKHRGVPSMRIPENGWFIIYNGKSCPIKMDDLGVPHFRKPPYNTILYTDLVCILQWTHKQQSCKDKVRTCMHPSHDIMHTSHHITLLYVKILFNTL